jgi:N-acyl-phosphatidylethanolamine-hydrolysing phospholipase D
MSFDPIKDRKGRYINPHVNNLYRRPKDFLLLAFGFFRDSPYEVVPEGFFYPMPDIEFDSNRPWAQWIGHATYLISMSGKHILTDPIWSNRCSPVQFAGPKRLHPPPMPISQLPKIDYVMISHDHYDHLDRASVEELNCCFPDIVWIVPKGVQKWFDSRGIDRVVELSWWKEVDLDLTFKIISTPSQHFSGRISSHVNRTLWSGYVVKSIHTNKTFYFVGDTGYNPVDFKEIGERFSQVDLSLIPIGSYSPRKFMAPVHVEPKDAVNIHMDVRSKFSLAMHWKTFKLSGEPIAQPPFDLLKSLKAQGLDPFAFLAPDPGIKINW